MYIISTSVLFTKLSVHKVAVLPDGVGRTGYKMAETKMQLKSLTAK
jgi:hypothetical protein